MSCYKIISVDPPGKAVGLSEEDSRLAFKVAKELDASIIDVLRDQKYLFSLCRMRGDDGYWVIFQRAKRTIGRLRKLSRNRAD